MQTKKILGIALAAALVSSMAVVSVSARDAMEDGEGATYFDNHTIGIVGGMTGWGNDSADIPMTDEDGDGIYVGTVELNAGEYEFKVRADSSWDDSWGEYEEKYDRTFNSQTNCKVNVEEDGTKLTVKLDATGEDGNVWPVTYFLGEEATEPEASAYSIIGANGDWATDIAMYEVEENVYEGTFNLSGEETEFKVRKDAGWDLSWGVYEPDYDRTQNSQTNCYVKAEDGAKVTVRLDATGDDLEVWPVLVSLNDGEFTESAGKPADPEPDESLKEYFYFDNSETKWDEVYAYWWTSDYSATYDKDGNLYGFVENETGYEPAAFPGTKMEQIEGTDTWRALIPYTAEKMIFNSGKSDEQIWAGETGYQTGDLEFDVEANAGQVYVIDTSFEPKAGRGVEKTKLKYNAGDWQDYTAETPEPQPEPEPSAYSIIGGMTDWSSDIAMYETEANIFEGTFTVEAGEYEFKVRKDAGWDLSWGVYEADYERTQNSQTNCYIKVDGTTEVTVRLDATGDDLEVWPVLVSLNGGEFTESAGKPADTETSEPSQDEPSEEPSQEPSEETPDEPVQMTVLNDYIYFDNSKTQWESVNAYWWQEDYARTYDLENNDYGWVVNTDGTEGGQPVAFPGTAMTQIPGTNVWQARIPFGATKIIFSSGKTDEQIWAGETGYQTLDLAFDATANAGQMYVIDTTVEPKAGRGVEKTKLKYGEGAWVDYNGEFIAEEIGKTEPGETSTTPGGETSTTPGGTSTTPGGTTPTPVNPSDSVKTGDATMPVAVASVAVAALGIAFFARKKTREE